MAPRNVFTPINGNGSSTGVFMMPLSSLCSQRLTFLCLSLLLSLTTFDSLFLLSIFLSTRAGLHRPWSFDAAFLTISALCSQRSYSRSPYKSYAHVSHNVLFHYFLFCLCRSQLYLCLVACERRACLLPNRHGHWVCWMSMGGNDSLLRRTHTLNRARFPLVDMPPDTIAQNVLQSCAVCFSLHQRGRGGWMRRSTVTARLSLIKTCYNLFCLKRLSQR